MVLGRRKLLCELRHIIKRNIYIIFYLALAARDGLARVVELVKSVCRLAKACPHTTHGIDEHIQAVIQLLVIVLDAVLVIRKAREHIKLRERRRNHQIGHASERKVLRADADGKVVLLSRKTYEEYCPEVTDELHLSSLCL